MTSSERQRITIGITGASGSIYGIRLLEILRDLDPIETHLVMSPMGQATIVHETDYSIEHVKKLADHTHSDRELGASISSGSYLTSGMVIAPCSIKTLAGVANSLDGNLVVRAADDVLKERRRLVLMVRETPLHEGHLRLMRLAAKAGAIIAPPVPAFYTRPGSLDDVIEHTCRRVLDLFGIHVDPTRRWGGLGDRG